MERPSAPDTACREPASVGTASFLGHDLGEGPKPGEGERGLLTRSSSEEKELCMNIYMVKFHEMDSLWGPVRNSGGSHYFIIFKIFLIDGLYSVIWYIDIMQELCITKDFNL